MYAGIDLGSTNLKCAVYDESMTLKARLSCPVQYEKSSEFVEFNAEKYVQDLLQLIRDTLKKAGSNDLKGMAFTGQAETLVVLGQDGMPLMNAISWMDERSKEECAMLSEKFSHEECEAKTGQMAVLPTWPATKILWLKHNRPDVYENAATYMLLKDYVVFCLTGKKLSDMSIATFSFYFDIYNKCYWKEMLEAIGVDESKLPPLTEPCTVAGPVTPEIADALAVPASCFVNVGTLDHFAGMIGTGNIEPGGITLSTGTVMAMATMCQNPVPKSSGIAMHYGFLPDTYIMLPVAESGGVSLEWFRRTCMKDVSFRTIDDTLMKRGSNDLIFLPYLVGTNAPEFDTDASGVFFGLRDQHDAFDMAEAVMEGVSFVLRRNTDQMAKNGSRPRSIIATGGGAKSPVWCQLQASITGLPVEIPTEKEAACLGAAMISAVSGGTFGCLKCAAKACVKMDYTYKPFPTDRLEKKYQKFNALYEAMIRITRM
ncbi:MAG: hypothetical protein IK088_08325 [Lachnospiraceae bacterium]|nr:hypothetical protein [Lachnospiraceae bacterium]